MKHPRLVALALAAFTVTACCVALAIAGGTAKGAKPAATDDCCAKGASATTASAACPATMNCPAGSAQCTAAQRAACAKMKTKMAAGSNCAMHGNATAAAAGNCAAHGAAMAGSGECAMKHGTAATTAAAGNCASHSASAAGCAGMGAKATMASGQCPMHPGAGNAAAAVHGDCAVCADEMACDNDVRGLNAHAQVVALRNGAMIVYTADTPETVRALQAAVARHNERIMNSFASNSDASLCGGCKSFRGAMASGKFSRELVNVKNGAQVLLTSSDPAIVQRIHDVTGAEAARTKS